MIAQILRGVMRMPGAGTGDVRGGVVAGGGRTPAD
jgi:hypothetical protein